MPTFTASKIPKKVEKAEDILARFCYYYPGYTYKMAQSMSAIRVQKMLKVALQERARDMHDLTLIASAPNSKNGSGVKKLLAHFRKVIDG